MGIEILYFDDKHNLVPKDKATQFVRRIVDGKGTLIIEQWGFINDKSESNKVEDED